MNNKSDRPHATISVVVPAYNEEKEIGKTLTAIRNQTIKDIELIVVDNNSTDKTAEIARSFHAKVIHETIKGAVFAYDAGMKQASGEIVVNIDADSIPEEKWLEKILNNFEKEQIIAVTGTGLVATKHTIRDAIINALFVFFLGFNFFIGKPHINGFNFAVKKEYFLKAGGMNTNFLMSFEVDFGLRLAKFGKIKFDKNLLVTTSTRRWHKGLLKTIFEYTEGYIYTIWLRKPPPFKQTVIRKD